MFHCTCIFSQYSKLYFMDQSLEILILLSIDEVVYLLVLFTYLRQQ